MVAHIGSPNPVLVVDDDAAYRYLVAKHLAQNGVPAIEARDTMEALDILDAHAEINRAVIDLMMPHGLATGISFARMARQRRPDFRCVLMSGFSELIGEPDFADFGGVLPKTSDLTGFVREILVRLEGRGPASPQKP